MVTSPVYRCIQEKFDNVLTHTKSVIYYPPVYAEANCNT